MIDPNKFHQQTKDINDLLRRKLGVRGRGFAARLHRAGRRLPKAARRAGEDIVRAQALIDQPKLARFLDVAELDNAFNTLTRQLSGIDAADRRKGAILGTLGGLVFNLIALIVVLIVLLRWRGII